MNRINFFIEENSESSVFVSGIITDNGLIIIKVYDKYMNLNQRLIIHKSFINGERNDTVLEIYESLQNGTKQPIKNINSVLEKVYFLEDDEFDFLIKR